MTLFEQVLQEASKARFITPFYDNGIAKKFEQIGIPTKEEMVNFYDTHNELASKIDWNKKKDDSFFEDLLYNMQNFSSKSTKKKNPIELFKSRKDCKIIGEDENWIYVMPLEYSAARWMDSFDCGGQGAKWCIGYEKTDDYWNSYNEHSLFILAFSKNPSPEENEQKYMIQFDQSSGYYEKHDFENPDLNIWNQPDKNIVEDLLSNGVFNEKYLLNLYQKAKPFDIQNNRGKYYSTSYEIWGTPDKIVKVIMDYDVKLVARKAPADYRQSDTQKVYIDYSDGKNLNHKISISLVADIINALKEKQIYSDNTIISVPDSLVIDNDSYKNITVYDFDTIQARILEIDVTKTKDLNALPIPITVSTGHVAIKLPLSYGLSSNFNEVAKKIISNQRNNYSTYAIVNESVKQSGNYFDGYGVKDIQIVTKEDVETEKIFYNAKLDVSQLSDEEINEIKSINSYIMKY